MTATRHRRSVLSRLVDRYPAGTFFVLTIVLSWGWWFPVLSANLGVPELALLIPGAFGPAVAAAIVTKVRGESVREWLVHTVNWRRSPRWYALALGIPVTISLALLGVLVGVTGTFDAAVVEQALLLFGVNVVFASILGGGQEEFGWRGFALPHLQARFDALTASLLIGAVWALWHAPMFLFGIYGYHPALYAAGVLAFAVVFTWYYNSSRGCLVGAILMHGTLNASVNVPPMLVGGPEAIPVPYEGLLAIAFWVAALLLIARDGRATLARGSKVLPTWTGSDGDHERPTEPAATTPETTD